MAQAETQITLTHPSGAVRTPNGLRVNLYSALTISETYGALPEAAHHPSRIATPPLATTHTAPLDGRDGIARWDDLDAGRYWCVCVIDGLPRWEMVQAYPYFGSLALLLEEEDEDEASLFLLESGDALWKES